MASEVAVGMCWVMLKQRSENVEPRKRRKPRRTDTVDGKKKVARRVVPPRLKQLCEAATQAREQLPRPLRISRTVELLSQKDEGWRESKSKLLYMTALGLTPILHKAGIPYIRCSVKRLQPSLHKKQRMMEDENMLFPKRSLQGKSKTIVTNRTFTQSESEIEIIDLTLDSEEVTKGRNVQTDEGFSTKSLPHRFPVLYELFTLINRIENRDKTTQPGSSIYRNNLLPYHSSNSNADNDDEDIIFLSQRKDDDVVMLN